MTKDPIDTFIDALVSVPNPLVRDQKGFSKHVFLEDNPELDFEKLTTGSTKFLNYIDDSEHKSRTRIYSMDWDGNPWKAKATRNPLVREQKGFSKHVFLEDNPKLDFEKLTTGSDRCLHYVDDKGVNRSTKINYMDWRGNPWKAKTTKFTRNPLVRDQKGFSKHVFLEDNPGLDFEKLTTGSGLYLNYVDEGEYIRHVKVNKMEWNGNPWKARITKRKTIPLLRGQDEKDVLVGEDAIFWNCCDETNPQKVAFLKKCGKWSRSSVRMHCKKGHHYTTQVETFFNELKEPCPYCAGRMAVPGENDAATVDPELDLFFLPEDNSIDIHAVTPKRKEKMRWKCPYCGYKFTMSLNSMVNRHPKCCQCKDTGIPEPFELRERELTHTIVVQGRKDV